MMADSNVCVCVFPGWAAASGGACVQRAQRKRENPLPLQEAGGGEDGSGREDEEKSEHHLLQLHLQQL